MGLPENKKYKAVNVGGLMIDDSIRVFTYLIENKANNPNLQELMQILPMKSEASQRRIFQELLRRFRQMDNLVSDYFFRAERNEQIILLFYAAMKNYQLLFDVVFQLVIPKYYKSEKALHGMDILAFFDNKVLEQAQIENWSVRTRKNMAAIMLMMLKESGIQKNEQIVPLLATDDFWRMFVKSGEYWMLDAALLSKEDKLRINSI
jgi:hypothetical protein